MEKDPRPARLTARYLEDMLNGQMGIHAQMMVDLHIKDVERRVYKLQDEELNLSIDTIKKVMGTIILAQAHMREHRMDYFDIVFDKSLLDKIYPH